MPMANKGPISMLDLREAQSYTQAEVALLVQRYLRERGIPSQCNKASIHNYETGEDRPQAQNAEALAAVYKVTLETLHAALDATQAARPRKG